MLITSYDFSYLIGDLKSRTWHQTISFEFSSVVCIWNRNSNRMWISHKSGSVPKSIEYHMFFQEFGPYLSVTTIPSWLPVWSLKWCGQRHISPDSNELWFMFLVTEPILFNQNGKWYRLNYLPFKPFVISPVWVLQLHEQIGLNKIISVSKVWMRWNPWRNMKMKIVMSDYPCLTATTPVRPKKKLR